jgi:hypothetical protein
MNINMIHYEVRKLLDKKTESSPNFSTIITSGGLSSISSIMNNVEGRAVAVSKSSSTSRDASAALLMLSLTTDNSIDPADKTNNVAAGSKTGANTAAEVSIKDFMSSLQQRDVDKPSTCVGRPKETTAADFMCLEERIESVMKEVTEWLARNTTKSRSKK